MALIRLERKLRGGGLGLDACLSQNQEIAREYDLTIPSDCYDTSPPPDNLPPTPIETPFVSITTLGDAESTNDTPSYIFTNGTATNGMAHGESVTRGADKVWLWIVYGIIVGTIFIAVVIVSLMLKSSKRREKRSSSHGQDNASSGNIYDRTSSPRLASVEKSRWTRIFRKGSQISNDSAIELGDTTPIKDYVASLGRRSPSQSSGFISITTLDAQGSGDVSSRSDLGVLEEVEVDITTATLSPSSYFNHPSSDNTTPRAPISASHPTSPVPLPRSSQPTSLFYNPQIYNHQSLPSRDSSRQTHDLDISESTAPVNHHERIFDEEEDEADDSTFGRVSSTLNAQERLASVVILQKRRARKLDSRSSRASLTNSVANGSEGERKGFGSGSGPGEVSESSSVV